MLGEPGLDCRLVFRQFFIVSPSSSRSDFGRNLYPLIWLSAARLAGAVQKVSIWSVRQRWPPVLSCRVGRDEAGHRGTRWWVFSVRSLLAYARARRSATESAALWGGADFHI